jgi:periplasmic copper chaperone A
MRAARRPRDRYINVAGGLAHGGQGRSIRPMKRLSLLIVVAFAAFGGIAQAQSSSGITVSSVWARATPGGAKTGVVYLTIENKGKLEDNLLGVTTPVADQAQLHSMKMDNGVMKMRPLAALVLAPGTTATLEPSGNHIMLMGLKRPLKQGGTFPLTLEFERAGKIEVQVTVAKIGATMAPGMKMDDMPGMDK